MIVIHATSLVGLKGAVSSVVVGITAGKELPPEVSGTDMVPVFTKARGSMMISSESPTA